LLFIFIEFVAEKVTQRQLFFQCELREEVTEQGDHRCCDVKEERQLEFNAVKRVGHSDHKRLVTTVTKFCVLLVRNKLLYNGKRQIGYIMLKLFTQFFDETEEN
jgi:hypothetical protein